MTDREDYGQQPPRGYGPQYPKGGPRQPEQDSPTAHLPRVDAPRGPRRRKPWAARHKVLAGFVACCGLVLVIGVAAAARSSSSSSTPAPTASTLTPRVSVAEGRSTANKTPAQTATTTAAPSTPARTTPASSPPAPSTPVQTTVAAQPVTSAAPARTTAAPAPPPSSHAPASCYPLSDEGTCYEPGEYCRDSDHGVSGVAGDGQTITCEDKDGWRWEPV
jgi:hypothetical protein